MKTRGPQPWPWTSAVTEWRTAHGRPTVPGTPGKAHPDAKRTEAGGLGAEDVATAERR